MGSAGSRFHLLIATRHQQTRHFFGVMLVHLAAKGFQKTFRARRHPQNARARRSDRVRGRRKRIDQRLQTNVKTLPIATNSNTANRASLASRQQQQDRATQAILVLKIYLRICLRDSLIPLTAYATVNTSSKFIQTEGLTFLFS